MALSMVRDSVRGLPCQIVSCASLGRILWQLGYVRLAFCALIVEVSVCGLSRRTAGVRRYADLLKPVVFPQVQLLVLMTCPLSSTTVAPMVQDCAENCGGFCTVAVLLVVIDVPCCAGRAGSTVACGDSRDHFVAGRRVLLTLWR